MNATPKARPKVKVKPKAPPKKPHHSSLYKPEYVGQLLAYFRDAEAYDLHYSDKGTAQILPGSKYPTMQAFAAKVGVYYETLNEWQAQWPEWKVAYQECLELQKAYIMQAGMSGASPAHFAIFLLKANHGMRDNVEVVPPSAPPTSFTLNVVTADNVKVEPAE